MYVSRFQSIALQTGAALLLLVIAFAMAMQAETAHAADGEDASAATHIAANLASGTPLVSAQADGDTPIECVALEGTNIGYQNYSAWSKPIRSYLTIANGGYMRVQSGVSGSGVLAIYYDRDFKLLSRQEIPQELSIFGGFYETDSNYFLVTGQNNEEENNETEVIRITKYDKNWNRLGSCGLYGANTVHPFDAGCCRFDHTGCFLVIRTCHEMYASSDGLNHQANVTILVNTDTMEVKDSHTSVANSNYGYVSHSFNQFIKLQNNNIVSVDHGDGHPRAICLMQYPTDVTTGRFNSYGVETTTVMSFPGETGNNATGASVGAFEISSSSYLVAGNSVVQDSENTKRKTRNVFVAAVDKTTKEVTTNWLTNNAEGEATSSTPHMVKVSDDRYMVLWTTGSNVYYTFVNGLGVKQSDIYSLEGALSDCAPIVDGSDVVWYTWKNGEEKLYRIPISSPGSPTVVEREFGHKYEWLGTDENGVVTQRCSFCGEETTGYAPTSFALYWKMAGADGPYYSSVPSGLMTGDQIAFYDTRKNYYSSTGTKYPDITIVLNDEDNCEVSGKTLTFKRAGTYTLTAYPTYNPNVKQTYTMVVKDPLESATLEINADSPYVCGSESIGLTAKPVGGVGTLTYTFAVIDAGGQETILAENASSPQVAWQPQGTGDYTLRVSVTDSEGRLNTVTSEDALFTVAAMGSHEYGEWRVTKQPTCTEKGSRERICSHCSAKNVGEIDANGHSYEELSEADGLKTFKCSVCGDEITGRVPTSFRAYWQDASSGSGSYSYLPPTGLEANGVAGYWIYVNGYSADSGQKLSEFKVTVDDSENAIVNSKAETITFLKAGTYEVTVTPIFNPSAAATYSITIVKPLEWITLEAGAESPQPFGSPAIVLTATPEGGKGRLQYTFTCTDANGQETTLASNTTSRTTRWNPSAAGEYRLRVSVKDPGDNDNTVTSEDLAFAIDPDQIAIRNGGQIAPTNELTYGQPLSCVRVFNPGFVAVTTGRTVAGTFAFDDPDAKLPAGEQEVAWTFTPTSENYAPYKGSMIVKVNKATPMIVSIPTVLPFAYHPTKTLAERPLVGGEATVPGVWSWADESIVPDVPGGTFGCVFTPNDSANYESLNSDVAINVTKATPHVVELNASQITYGQSLADSKLSGSAQYDESDAAVVTGFFAWIDGTVQPAVADSNTTEYDALFTPEDSVNYESVGVKATVPVAKADRPATWPSESYNVAYGVGKLANDILGLEDWEFDAADIGSDLVPGEEATFTTAYVGEDAANFENTTAQVKVARSTCNHESTEIRGAKDATCTEDGYTGDTYCTICNEKLYEGQVVQALDHEWNAGVVTKEPTCSEEGIREFTCGRCSETRTEPIEKIAHTWEWKIVEEPTCAKSGAKQQVCSVCGEIGETAAIEIDPSAHKWDEGRISIEPSCTGEGERTFTCENDPSHVKLEPVPALGHEWGEWTVITEPTVSAPGLKGRMCTRCTEVEQQEIPKLTPTPVPDSVPTSISGDISPDNPVAAEAVERQITGLKSDSDPVGSTFALLQAKGVAKSKTAVKLSWKRVPGATGYVVYGNKCGKGNKYQKITTVGGNSFTQKKLKKGTYYKYLVVAVKGKAALATAKTIHVATKGGKVGNAKSVKTKAKAKVKLKKGKKLKLKAKAVPQSKKLKVKKHRAIAYDTTNPSVATVTKKGVVQAKKPGTCTVYAYAQNGVCKAVKVTVK